MQMQTKPGNPFYLSDGWGLKPQIVQIIDELGGKQETHQSLIRV